MSKPTAAQLAALIVVGNVLEKNSRCGALYACGERVTFSLSDVSRWGKMGYYGDNRSLTVAELIDGPQVKVKASWQTPDVKREIDRITRRLAKDGVCAVPTRMSPFVIVFGEITDAGRAELARARKDTK